MNTQNIQELSDQLQSLGLNDLAFELFQKICFKPDHFVLSKKVQEDKDWLNVELFFKADPNSDEYVLMYYDAVPHKEMELPDISINGINIIPLDQKMKEIDWAVSFNAESRNQWDLSDKLSLETGRKIEKIVEELTSLDSTQEGKFFAAGLKLKYWAGMPDQNRIDITSPLINKSEFTQRFYFFEGKADISIQEAYRFLQNKWLEKQFLEKEKDDFKRKGLKGKTQTPIVARLVKKKQISAHSNSNILPRKI